MEIFIDKKKLRAKKGETILMAAERNEIKIPALCRHGDLKAFSSCRLCVVEIEGRSGFWPACSTMVEKGMKIKTSSPALKRVRRVNLELLFSQHEEECFDCVWQNKCQLLDLAKEYGVETTRFKDRKSDFPIYHFGPALIYDSSKCIDCRNCIEMCALQGVNFLELEEKDTFHQVVPSKNKKIDCVYCGQCLMHCPAGAFEGEGEFEKIEAPLRQKNKIIIAQFAPSLRSSLGEEFGLPGGRIITGQLTAALRKLGFDWVFDTSSGADFTTYEEAKEVKQRLLSGKRLPILTSCCPSWVRFVELFYPDFIPNLTTVRSPQAILGGLIKTYWAKKENIDPKNIIVVSIMPCIAKKYEITRPELKIGRLRPVDYVLTTRELAWLLRKKKIDFAKLKGEKIDSAFDEPTGAGIIYGASGGVMESAFRTVYEGLTKKKLKKVDFKEIRGMEGIKTAEIKIGKEKRRIAVVNGLGNAKKLLEKIKQKEAEFDCIEVMACPGGCVGGGGQPLPSESKNRIERAKGLYRIDSHKKIRRAHENKGLLKVYEEFLSKNKKISHKILHTHYSRKTKTVIKKTNKKR